MENTSLKNLIEGLTADQVELQKFIGESTRPNVKRSLEEQLKMVNQRREEEQRKLDVTKSLENASNLNSNSANNYESVNKYSFDAGNKFVKYIIFIKSFFLNFLNFFFIFKDLVNGCICWNKRQFFR